MQRAKRRPVQKPLSPTEAWDRIINVPSGEARSSRLRKSCVREVSDLRDHDARGKRRRYQDFQHEVLRRCGPTFFIACAIGMGQAQIANMNSTDRRALLDVISRERSSATFLPLKDLVPDSLKELPQRPPERGLVEYFTFKMAILDRISELFPPYLYEGLNEGTLRVWEITKCPELLATENIKTEITWTSNYDGVMFFDVGFAQEIAAMLFPSGTRAAVRSCCKWVERPHNECH